MKYIGYVLALVVIVGGIWYLTNQSSHTATDTSTPEVTMGTSTAPAGSTVVHQGSYNVDPTQSIVNWSGTKPLIANYTDKGTIGLKDGTLTVGATTASGTLTIDMNSLTVTNTTRTGAETKLQEELKQGDFFEVGKYPTASFTITKITPRSDSSTTFVYDVTGDLTMKDKTNTITFPATIYADSTGTLHAFATTAIDRTKWGITFHSGNFFQNLGDSVIDDMVQLSFTLVAKKN